MNKYQKQIDKAKSIKALQKVANSLGVGIGNMKNIDKIKSKLTKALIKEQTQIERDLAKHRAKVENSINYQNRKVKRLYKERNKIINDIKPNIQLQLLNLTNDLTKANNQFKYLSGNNVKLNSILTTTADTEAPLKIKGDGVLMGTNHKSLIDQLTKENEELRTNYIKFTKPNKEFSESIENYLDEYENSGYLLESEKKVLLDKLNKFNYVKQSYFLNQIVTTSKEHYRLDEDVDEDLKLKFNNFINDMVNGINNIM